MSNTFQVLTNCIDSAGNMESTQVTADKTVMSPDGQFIHFIKGGEEVATLSARHIVYVKRI